MYLGPIVVLPDPLKLPAQPVLIYEPVVEPASYLGSLVPLHVPLEGPAEHGLVTELNLKIRKMVHLKKIISA